MTNIDRYIASAATLRRAMVLAGLMVVAAYVLHITWTTLLALPAIEAQAGNWSDQ